MPGGELSVLNRAWYWYFNKYLKIEGTATCPTSDAKCIVNFGNQKSDRVNYNVLFTDYDRYAVVYSCYNLTSWLKSEYFWVLSRHNTLENGVMDEIKAKVRDHPLNYNIDKFTEKTLHTNCEYAGTPEK